MAAITISRTELGRRTREILEQVHRGGSAVIESRGRRQAVLVDDLDYRLLRSLADLAVESDTPDGDSRIREALARYLRREISLGKAAEELAISRFELVERFKRLGVPLHLGPESVADARAEVAAARRHGDSG
jgi:prevent-host-death family protein